MNTRATSLAIWSLLALSAAAATATDARAARVLPNLNTDSLVLQSQLILVGDLVAATPEPSADRPLNVWTVKVARVLNGPVPAGETVTVAGLDGVRRSDDLGGGPLKAGDRVMLFLNDRKPDRGTANVRDASAMWTATALGTRLIQDGRAYCFFQNFFGIGGSEIITATPRSRPGTIVALEGLYEARVRKAIVEMPQLAQRVEQAQRDDVPQLLALLRGRRHGQVGEIGSDLLTARLLTRIGALANADTLFALYQDSPQLMGRLLDSLAERFDGRQRLFAFLQEPAADHARRLTVARALADSAEANEDVLAARLATLAVAERAPDVACELISGIRGCIPFQPSSESAGGSATHLAKAADVLVAHWNELQPRVQFEAAVTLRLLGPAAINRVLPQAGAFLSQVEPDLTDPRPLDATRQVRLVYRWHNFLTKDAPAAGLSLVFREERTRREIEVPLSSNAPQSRSSGPRGNRGSGFRLNLPLPAGITPGSYEVFLRAHQSDQSIGDGIGCWIVVPATE